MSNFIVFAQLPKDYSVYRAYLGVWGSLLAPKWHNTFWGSLDPELKVAYGT